MIDSKLEVKNNRNKSSEKELEVSNWASVPQADKVWKQKSAKKLQLILLNNSVCQSRSPFIVLAQSTSTTALCGKESNCVAFNLCVCLFLIYRKCAQLVWHSTVLIHIHN